MFAGALAFAIPPRYPISVPSTARPPSELAYACGFLNGVYQPREKQNYNPRCDSTEQLPLQHGEKPVRKVLRAHPGAIPASCMVAGGIFSGFLVQPGHDQA